MRLYMIAVAALTVVAVIPACALASPETDQPHRPWGKTAILDMTPADAQTCIARSMDKIGSVLVLPIDGGTDIDFTLSGGWLTSSAGEAYARFQIRTDAGSVKLSGLYRRPLGANFFDGMLKSLQKRCLIVKDVIALPAP